MTKKTFAFSLLMTALVLTSAVALSLDNVEAVTIGYTIEKVNHTVEIMHDGSIFINDTIQLDGTAPNVFLIGFPYKYGLHVLACVAYNATEDFAVRHNVPLDSRIGFYGVAIDFPQGVPRVFTVGFILSNNLLTQEPGNMSNYILDFPAYPTLTENAANCNVSILLPEGSTHVDGTINTLTYWQENLPAFTNSPSNVTFSSTEDEIQIVDVKELKREIRVNGVGEIEGSDTYRMTNKGFQTASSVEIVLPQNASNLSAHDGVERKLTIVATEKVNRYRVSFASPLETEKSTVFTVKYSLLGDEYIKQKEPRRFDLTFPLFQDLNYYINRSSVTFVLPEGAKMLSFESTSVSSSHSITRNIFQETLAISGQGAFSLYASSVRIIYSYDLLWLSFRPTLWMWALTIVGCALAVVWKRPKASISVAVPRAVVKLGSKDITSFVDAYERKTKITLEMQSLKARARKGKIPRRRYKVRRKTLETRLNAVSRNLTNMKEKVQAAGGRYRDLMRQLEVAETETNEVEANIESIEGRHRRGELSLGAYRKILADYERRKEKAEMTIDEILMRLREEVQ